ncbi:Protoheme IX farnesyltransferase [Candidatus Portiera aleyrodidarum]|uniref:Protoheme IX farnesyltransferase n=1 Tax=Candidatus Portiera aleyrodidarum TaxID=91844 RepID=A0A6S6S092_9GAMM|nr:heme o synthase [Candidatus Portiera aleyrodidarum]CAA3710493.1 Protoheme IX farnesyltransferase [Candidatus Portiera aleyrodidarum]
MVNKNYFLIIKPKILIGNLISILGGIFLSYNWTIKILLGSLLGIILIIASSCIINNYIDLDIDSIMLRTNNRVLIKEFIFTKKAINYAYILFVLGITILYKTTNILVTSLSLIGIVIYILMYSLYYKRNSAYSTLIGSLSGSLPPIMGYCSISNNIDLAAIIIFLIHFLWQIPHSYSIALLKKNEYMLATIPIFPTSKGLLITKQHIIIYILCFIFAEIMLFFNGFTGFMYLTSMTFSSIYWLIVSLLTYKSDRVEVLSNKIFLISIFIIICFNLMIFIDVKQP